MKLEITFELTDTDLEYFRAKFHEAATRNPGRNSNDVPKAVRNLVEKGLAGDPPDFVRWRLSRLDLLNRMVEDDVWQLSSDDRDRVLEMLAYFVEPDDIIADDIPVLGFIDDAIAIELILRALCHEIEAYEEFSAFRSAEAERRANLGRPTDISKEDWLADQRAVLHSRMRERRVQSPAGWQNTLFSWGLG